MYKKVLIIKNALDADSSEGPESILKYAKESLKEGKQRYYSVTGRDREQIEQESEEDEESYVAILSHRDGKIESMYLGTGHIQPNLQICYTMKEKSENTDVIDNLFDNLELDLKNDFAPGSYVLISSLKSLRVNLQDLLYLKEPAWSSVEAKTADEGSNKWDEYVLECFAQHDNQCLRQYEMDQDPNRSNFQRDRERIVNSKAFRRLVDKAQVFSAEKGDHYRTRMTHTLEVNQIAKAIAAALHLNLDLTEAIALGHDLGHTPFGHQGERTLDQILTRESSAERFHIAPAEALKHGCLGRFKHNVQSVRVLCQLEERYVKYPGLNISMQTLEGILKHTKVPEEEQLKKMIAPEILEKLHPKTDFATSLEGQVVFCADEIAQRGHDIDDALTSGMLQVDELLACLETAKFSKLREALQNEKESVEDYCRPYADQAALLIGRMMSQIVDFLIKDVIQESKKNLGTLTEESADGAIEKKIIQFSKDGQIASQYLEKLVTKKAISSPEVIRFDHNGATVVETLFWAYYRNPELLHQGTQRRIYADMLSSAEEGVREGTICFVDANRDILEKELGYITNMQIELGEDNEPEDKKDERCCFEKRKILIRRIVDYIAGMTDSYAMAEYRRILR